MTKRRIRRDRVAEMLLRGICNQGEIAKEFGVSRTTISRDIATIERQWHRETMRNYDAYKAKQLRELEEVKHEAWTAWNESRSKFHKIVSKTNGGKRGKSKPGEITTTVEERCGDPRFLSVVLDCIDKQSELAGLKIQKLAMTDPSGTREFGEQLMDKIASLAEEIGPGSDIIDAEYVQLIADAAEAEGDGKTGAVQDTEEDGGESGGQPD